MAEEIEGPTEYDDAEIGPASIEENELFVLGQVDWLRRRTIALKIEIKRRDQKITELTEALENMKKNPGGFDDWETTHVTPEADTKSELTSA